MKAWGLVGVMFLIGACDQADLHVSWTLEEGSTGSDPIPQCPGEGKVVIEATEVEGGDVVSRSFPCSSTGNTTLEVHPGLQDVRMIVLEASGRTFKVSDAERVDVGEAGAEVRVVIPFQ